MKTLNACKVGMALTAAAFLGLATAQPADAISFYLTDLGTLGGNSSSASAINELGQVAGTSTTADGQSRAFFWDNSSGMTNLGIIPPGGYNYCFGYYDYGYGYGPCPSTSASSATAINDLGQVIGSSTTMYDGGSFGPYRGPYYERNLFFWDKSSGMISLGTPVSSSPGVYYFAKAINNLGQVIGNKPGYYRSSGQYPFFWEKNTGITNLVTPEYYNYSFANAINNLGQVVGDSLDNSPNSAFLWEKGSGIRYLGTLGGSLSSASAINDLGQVVGESTTADGKRRAFFWDNSSGMINLGVLGSGYSSATAINDLGQVIGSSSTADGQGRAFLWEKNSGIINLGSLGAYDNYGYMYNSSYATAINNLGQVIGYSTNANGLNRPFFWDKNSGMSDLNDLISDLGWTLNTVIDINNVGQIVGNGLYNGQQRAFVLTPKPVPEPSSALAFLAFGCFCGSLTKRKQQASSRN